MAEAYRVRFVSFNKDNGFWFAHVSEHPEEQLKMESDCAAFLDNLAGSENTKSMDLAIAGEYPYDDSKLRLTKIHQDEFGATYKVLEGRRHYLYDLLNRIIRLGHIPSTLFDDYPSHIDILDVKCD